ncbi:MAG: hypothetical protein JNK93_16675 [Planctomycetia bacterium]|nr:hypothetical protein [Planctomycetia bacterium]
MDSTLPILAVDRGQFNEEMPGERRDVRPPVLGQVEHRRADGAPFAGSRTNGHADSGSNEPYEGWFFS